MDPTPTFEEFHAYLAAPTPLNVDAAALELEAFYPDILQLVQKDSDFFSQPRMLFGLDLGDRVADDTLWKHLQMCVFSSFFHGDLKTKIGVVFETAKKVWAGSGQTNAEVDSVLNDEKTQDHLAELYDYVTNLRSAKVCISLLEEIDVDSLGLSLDNPADLFDMVRNPEHPTMKKCIAAVQKQLQTKLKRGELTQTQLISDIEGLKIKVQGLFGNLLSATMFGEGRAAAVPSSVMMSNSTEARRQRMLARLQRKQREKTQ